MNTYPEFDLKFSKHPVNQLLAILAAMRHLEMYVLLLNCNYKVYHNAPANYHTYVCDVGGNMASHFSAGRLNLHCCSPVLSPRDDARFTDQLNSIAERTTLSSNQARYFWTILQPVYRRCASLKLKTAILPVSIVFFYILLRNIDRHSKKYDKKFVVGI